MIPVMVTAVKRWCMCGSQSARPTRTMNRDIKITVGRDIMMWDNFHSLAPKVIAIARDPLQSPEDGSSPRSLKCQDGGQCRN